MDNGTSEAPEYGAGQSVPFKADTWPVDADGFAPHLCTVCGTPVRYGSRHSRCSPELTDSPPSRPVFGIVDPDYARIFTQARVVAWQYGYACLAHGSFTRDLDLLLVPWADRAIPDAEEVVQRIADVCGLRVQGPPTKKPHGRLAWSLLLPGNLEVRWVDVSAIPSPQTS